LLPFVDIHKQFNDLQLHHIITMDVEQAHFRKQLLSILKNIANATFITFDLEMSGITTRPKYSSGDRSHDVGKPTLQHQYEEMKSAAETFQILQMGITCVEEDREKGKLSPLRSHFVLTIELCLLSRHVTHIQWPSFVHTFLLWLLNFSLSEYYLARPYNFNLSPISAEGVDLRLERVFSFSSSACDFLSKNKFEFGKVFSQGVPYLSRQEEDECRDEFNQRADKNSKIPDIIIAADDSGTLEFYRDARRTISSWAKLVKVCVYS
jgi:poly(A)-specific ribonuclease